MADSAMSVEVHHDINGAVATAVDRAITEHGEIGLQISAVRDGCMVVDVAAGVADIESSTPVTSESLFPVFSATKGVVAALALRLLGAGVIELDAPLAEVWPEFAAHGKAKVTLEHALTHAAGIPQMPDGVTPEVMCDWDRMCGLVADLEPLWKPGTQVGYHAYTYGWMVGEALRRSARTDASVGELVRELIALPSGAPDFWIGTPVSEHPRIVTLYKEPRPAGAAAGLIGRSLPSHLATGQDIFGRRDVRECCYPAAGGITTARSLATVFAALAADGTANGTQIVRAEWIENAARARWDETDVVLGERLGKGLGYYVSSESNHEQGAPFESGQRVFGHPGSGGSIAWADRALRTGFAITRSRMTTAGWHDPVVRELVRVVRKALSSLDTGQVK